jgi:transcriptional regulator of acetoin/glycerol metabolism
MDEISDTSIESKPQLKLVATTPVALHDLAEEAIRAAMQQHAGNVSAVARQLGISRNTLYRKMKSMILI